jgi:hypothetical protein
MGIQAEKQTILRWHKVVEESTVPGLVSYSQETKRGGWGKESKKNAERFY